MEVDLEEILEGFMYKDSILVIQEIFPLFTDYGAQHTFPKGFSSFFQKIQKISLKSQQNLQKKRLHSAGVHDAV